jgi:hypothetical protein
MELLPPYMETCPGFEPSLSLYFCGSGTVTVSYSPCNRLLDSIGTGSHPVAWESTLR